MEVLGLAIVGVLVGWYYGLFDAAEVGARMGTRELVDLERDQKAKLLKKAASRKIDADEAKSGAANNAIIDAYL